MEEGKQNNLKLTDGKKTTGLALSKQGLQEALEYATLMVKSKITPFNTAEQALVAITYGREIGMTPAVSMQNISVVNGKASLGIHAVSSRLINGGVSYEEVCNAQSVPTYFLFYPDDETKSELITEKHYLSLVADGFPVKLCDFFGSKEQQKKQKQQYYEKFGQDFMLVGRKPQEADKKTVIKFQRYVKENGQAVLKTHTETLYVSDISESVRSKDNWINNFRVMLRTRALMFGSRYFAPDLMSGVYDLTEMLETFNANFDVDANGEVTTITDFGDANPDEVVINIKNVDDAEVVNEQG